MIEPVTDWIDVNTVSLRYFKRCGEGVPIVLVHEMGGCIEGWADVLGHLAPDRPVLAYDQRGFGLSEKLREFTLEDHVHDLAGLLDHVFHDQPVLIASAALGAAVAIAYALAWPERVAGLVLSSPATGGMLPAPRQAMEQRLEAVRRHGLRHVSEAMFEITYPPTLIVAPGQRQRHRQRWMAMPESSFESVSRMTGTFDLEPSLCELACPALIIGCTHDPVRSPARSRALCEFITRGRYVEVESGHYLHLQHPAIFAEQIEAFIGA